MERGSGIRIGAEIGTALHERIVLEKLRRRREEGKETTIEGLIVESLEETFGEDESEARLPK